MHIVTKGALAAILLLAANPSAKAGQKIPPPLTFRSRSALPFLTPQAPTARRPHRPLQFLQEGLVYLFRRCRQLVFQRDHPFGRRSKAADCHIVLRGWAETAF